MSFQEIDRAHVLAEALPYIQRFSGKTIIVKYDSSAVPGEARDAAISDMILLSLVGVRVVLLHSGRTEIDAMLARLGLESRFEGGLRCTGAEIMPVVQQVLCGQVNKDLVAVLNRLGGRAVGLCGLDGALFQAKMRDEKYGLVGDIAKVDAAMVAAALNSGYIPVVAPVAQGVDSQASYNLNSDTAAARLAVALEAEKLVLLTGVRGLFRDPADESTLIPELQLSSVPALVRDGTISGPMVHKVDCCVDSVRSGVGSAVILDGRVSHSLLTELLTDAGVGTMLTN